VTPLERAGFLAHARMPAFVNLVQRSTDLISTALDQCSNPYVAFSCGKDSGVMLHLVAHLTQTIPARCLTSGETRILHGDFDIRWQEWTSRLPHVHFEEVNIDRVFSDTWVGTRWNEQRKAGRGDIIRFLPGGHDAVFIGLRDEESNARRHANKGGLIRHYSRNRKDNCAGMMVCCPIARWKLRDIAAYTVLHDLPLLAAYSAGFEARTTARLTGDAMRQNGLQSLRLKDPNGFNHMLQRFPEISYWAG
jgi:3'-phosphoadenosine 5'-phosphosulfate sulfotransferase (PAPS reductase)/FAD synthetase